MAAIKKEELEAREAALGLTPDGLSYQHRCSRLSAIERGEEWTAPVKKEKKKMPASHDQDLTPFNHPLWGKRILITPLMRPDAQRNLAYDEDLGPDIEVRDFSAGEKIYGAPEDVTRMVGDYEIIRTNPERRVVAKTTFPKIGTEISWCLGKELVPVVRGNDGQRGYIWSFPTRDILVEDTRIRVYGLKTLIQTVFPELLPKFSGKPIMSYIDGVTLAANIPMTEAILKEKMRQEKIDARAGIGW